MALSPHAVTSPKTVRANAVARLIAAKTAAGNNVFNSRTTGVDDADLPVLNVETPDATLTTIGDAPTFRTTMGIQVDGWVGGATDAFAADARDDLEMEVRAAFFGSAAWIALYRQTSSVRIVRAFGEEGDRRFAAFRLTFEIGFEEEYELVTEDAEDLLGVDLEFDRSVSPSDPAGTSGTPVIDVTIDTQT